MAGSTAIGYVGGRLLECRRPAHRRKVVLGVGVFGVLAVLGYFKVRDPAAAAAREASFRCRPRALRPLLFTLGLAKKVLLADGLAR
jgi:hypothetical protein